MQAFGGKRCHFLRRYQKKIKKTKDFRVLAKAGRVQNLCFFWFLRYPSRKMQAFGGKRCHFLRRYQKKIKKTKDFRVLAKAGRVQNLCFFWFFWYPSRKMQAFGGKRCHFLRRYQKTKKTKDFRVLAKARPEESKIFGFFLVFLVPLQENASFWWKTLPFPEEVQNKTKTSSSTSKQKHIFRFDKNPIDSSCFQVPDSGFKFQDLAIARIKLLGWILRGGRPYIYI